MTNAELEKIINYVFQDEEDALSIDRRRFMECFDNMLTERHTEVLRLRAIEGLTLEDTGKRLGITKERVRQIEAKAMRRLNASYFRHRFTTVTVEEMQEICRDLEDAKNEIASLKKDRDLYYRLLSKLVKDVIIPDVETSDPVEAGEKLSADIEVLGLSNRSYRALKYSGINIIGDLAQKSDDELMRIRNFGAKSFKEVKKALTDYLGDSTNENA